VGEGRLYFLDDSVLEGIPMYDDGSARRYAPAGSCLFREEEGALVPFAIRLEARGRISRPVDGDGWELAKTFLRASEANVHQVITHAVRTHLALEPYILATMRQLSSRHPIFKLLRRHFRGTIRINAEARQVLLGAGGVFDEFVACGGPARGQLRLGAKAWAAWTLRDNQPSVDLANRAMAGASTLDYPFGEATTAIYETISKYVAATLSLYYGDGAGRMATDPELAGWIEELREYAHAGALLGARGTVPSLESLVAILSTVIFTASVLHAAVNFQQYEHFGFVLNAPASVRIPPTAVTAATKIADKIWMDAYPDFKQTARQIAVSYSLSRTLPDDEFLLPPDGRWKESYFVETKPKQLIAEFHAALEVIKQHIEASNVARGRRYWCLLPDQIPTSTAI
jgi:arachidonate 5-lipoxygenase